MLLLQMKMNVKARMAAVITNVTITSAAITALVVSDTNFSLMASHAIVSKYISSRFTFKITLGFLFFAEVLFCFVCLLRYYL